MPNVMIVTHCKGRLHQLQQALPLALKQKLPPGYFMIGAVVVDFGCPDDSWTWVLRNIETVPNQEIGVAVVQDNTDIFQLCRARNIGCLEAFSRLDAELVFLMDCDILMHNEDCVAAYIREYERVTREKGIGSGVVGTSTTVWDEVKGEEVQGMISACLISSGAFHHLKGYDESHTGYGHDDTNFFLRAKLSGLPFSLTPLDYEHLHYDPELRDQYLPCKRSRPEIERTAAWCNDMDRPVNPKGYGEYKGFFITKEPR